MLGNVVSDIDTLSAIGVKLTYHRVHLARSFRLSRFKVIPTLTEPAHSEMVICLLDHRVL